MHLKKQRLQNHIAALERQPRRLPPPIRLFYPVCFFVVFSQLSIATATERLFPFFVVLFAVKRRRAQTQPAALR